MEKNYISIKSWEHISSATGATSCTRSSECLLMLELYQGHGTPTDSVIRTVTAVKLI